MGSSFKDFDVRHPTIKMVHDSDESFTNKIFFDGSTHESFNISKTMEVLFLNNSHLANNLHVNLFVLVWKAIKHHTLC